MRRPKKTKTNSCRPTWGLRPRKQWYKLCHFFVIFLPLIYLDESRFITINQSWLIMSLFIHLQPKFMEKLFPVWRLSRLYILVPILESLPTSFLDLCQIAGVPAPPVNANLQPLCDESHFPAATSVWWSPGGKSTALSSALALAAGRGCACQLGLSALLDIHNHQSHLNKIVITFNRYNIVVFTKPRAPTFAPQPFFLTLLATAANTAAGG